MPIVMVPKWTHAQEGARAPGGGGARSRAAGLQPGPRRTPPRPSSDIYGIQLVRSQDGSSPCDHSMGFNNFSVSAWVNALRYSPLSSVSDARPIPRPLKSVLGPRVFCVKSRPLPARASLMFSPTRITHNIYIYIYKCIYIYMYIYMSIYLYIYMSIYLYLSLSIYIYIYISIYLSLSLYIYIYIYLSLYISLSLYIYIYLYT